MSGGVIFGIQRFSVHDGPGIRTTVFLKGCNMRCRWCHNPESWATAPELSYRPSACTLCRGCAAACPVGAHRFEEGGHAIDRAACIACGLCAAACPAKALEVVGERVTVDQVMAVIVKDGRYYASSGGGVTLSGGEALLQPEFAMAILRRCAEAGLHCALETNGTLPWARYERALPYVGLFLVDYKLTDAARHLAYTGLERDIVLHTIDRLHAAGAPVLLRCPIIPGVNDDDGHLRAIARLTARHPGLLGAELLAYHSLGAAKAGRLGLAYQEFEQPPDGALEGWKGKVAAMGGRLLGR
ncbi:MAG: glycyl-radical enzyme activating protein [Clostridiales bacterium]|nr:glycyl-radical enzyme activating protein [Clostridiales bacterium]